MDEWSAREYYDLDDWGSSTDASSCMNKLYLSNSAEHITVETQAKVFLSCFENWKKKGLNDWERQSS